MLSQAGGGVGCSHVDQTRVGSGSAAAAAPEWRALCLPGRGRGGVTGGAVVCSQGVQAAPVERSCGSARSQLRLDGDDVGVASRDGGAGGPGLVGRLARVSLRPPVPVPDGGGDDGDGEGDGFGDGDASEGGIGSDGGSADYGRGVGGNGGGRGVVAQPILQDKGKKETTSFERFARARAAGRELVERNKGAAGLGVANEEGVFYKPRVGDYVMGVVASGNFSKLDVNIGAKNLGHLFRKDVMPLDSCSIREMSWEFSDGNSAESSGVAGPRRGLRFVRDEDVLNMAIEAPMAVELGTVLTMEVKGMTPSGRALLSARSVAREYAWQRVRQLFEYNAVLEVEIMEWTTAGLVSRIEGLRAFLPIYYLVNRAPDTATSGSVSYKEYVGQKISIMISSVDKARSNVVISEKKAWMTKNAYFGALVEGIVTEIQPYGVHIRMKNTDMSGVLHISNISRAKVNNIASVFYIGEEVKVMVVPSSKNNRLSFSTVELESEHGLILRDKEAVFQEAERIAAEIAKTYERKQSESTPDSNIDNADLVGRRRAIANWDWLYFGDKTEVD
ncbi:hypothetical protein KC19_2G114100 [Ceratodon purpureus]|uniref:S1 motif domain-containing protein n=1 Tax=Ceratodon purpureus TaxID=3225 RepID=A0A8T0IUV3_CERPU|nr:hypothetical protein KC19_2G114100 [Ceratodon purpureus]